MKSPELQWRPGTAKKKKLKVVISIHWDTLMSFPSSVQFNIIQDDTSRQSIAPGAILCITGHSTAHGPDPAWFWVDGDLRVDFTLISDWKEIKRRIFWDTWKWYEIQISVPINKILLEDCHPQHLRTVLGCFCATKAELNSSNSDRIACKAENINYMALYKVCQSCFKELLSMEPVRTFILAQDQGGYCSLLPFTSCVLFLLKELLGQICSLQSRRIILSNVC